MISLKTCKLHLWGFSIPVIYPMIDAFWLRAWWHWIILIYKDKKPNLRLVYLTIESDFYFVDIIIFRQLIDYLTKILLR